MINRNIGMSAGKTLYVSDMDGTLLDSDARLSHRTVTMLNELIADGALFTVATARTPATVSQLLKEVNLNLPAVVLTGAAIWDKETGRYSHVCKMAAQAARDLLRIYRENRLSAFLYTLRDDGVLHIYHTGPMSELEQKFVDERIDSPYKKFYLDFCPSGGWINENDERLGDVLDNVILLFALRPTEEVHRVWQLIKDKDWCRPFYYHDQFGKEVAEMEVFSPEVSKAAAVAKVKEMCHADRVVVFGDNVNDLPMMARADVAVAVENAVSQVRDRADIIIGANTTDAVAHFIKENYRK